MQDIKFPNTVQNYEVNKNLQSVIVERGSDIYLEPANPGDKHVTAVILGKTNELNISTASKKIALELSEVFADLADMLE